MNIENGFKIDQPNVFVPWDIEEKELKELFKGAYFTKVTTGYYVTHGECLGGLKCKIGFHFDPIKNAQLKELEFFRTNYATMPTFPHHIMSFKNSSLDNFVNRQRLFPKTQVSTLASGTSTELIYGIM